MTLAQVITAGVGAFLLIGIYGALDRIAIALEEVNHRNRLREERDVANIARLNSLLENGDR